MYSIFIIGRCKLSSKKKLWFLFSQVGWVKADTKAIQAIHEHVITHNPRVSVSHGGHAAWNLHIRDVQEEDRGYYMCQINTDPMKSQVRWDSLYKLLLNYKNMQHYLHNSEYSKALIDF